MPSDQSVSQQAHKGPAASTTGNLACRRGGHAAGRESITFSFHLENSVEHHFGPNDK